MCPDIGTCKWHKAFPKISGESVQGCFISPQIRCWRKVSWTALWQSPFLFLCRAGLVDSFRLGHLIVVHRNWRLSHWRDEVHWEIRSHAHATKIFAAKHLHEHNSTSATEVDGIAQKIKLLTSVSDCRIHPYSSIYALAWFQSNLSPLKKNAHLKYSGFVFNRLSLLLFAKHTHTK